MEWYWALTLLLGGAVALLILGLPVAFAFFAANIAGAFFFMRGHIGLSLMPIEYTLSVTKFTLVPVALFILMGEILFQTGVAFRSISAIDKLISRMPGRLSIVSIAGGTVFSSLSGSTIANTALLGNLMLPDMLKKGYHPTIAVGPIMAVGGIAMLIPPSALAVLLASLAERSITDLLMAGVIPGILMAASFVGYVVIRCKINPDLAPPTEAPTESGWARIRPFFVDVLPLFLIFAVVVGSIFFRIAAPEEAAALGCIAALVISAAYRKLNWAALRKALRETAKINVMLLFIIAGSLTFAQVLQISGATAGVLGAIQSMEMSQLTAMLMMMLLLLFLGCFMDQISMILLTLPFFLPLGESLGMNPTWLMVMMLIAMEISLLTPPFGLLLFVMKGVAPAGVRITQIYRAALPFITLEILIMVLIGLVPAVALWLPEAFK
ncbi:TRAP transporter large permease subunit [Maritimibacter sp. DP07]|jgi:tripartite ATP-independent transporter DctM subunit|uniref:TRAP transporter large permease protein n=2 Tax=Maritimibacter harenae TaxID=2606218 RepID=A0A845M944_9RHOB|nr:TRAP transporter large permease subunit [Maritimibacter harenae]